MVATAVCRASGLVGGVYAPSLFVGAALGAAFHILCQNALTANGALLDALPLPMHTVELADTASYALIGAATMLAAHCKVPLTAVLLLFELTRDYSIVLPTLLTVGIARWGSAGISKVVARRTTR